MTVEQECIGQIGMFPSGSMGEERAGIVDLVANDPNADRDWDRFKEAVRKIAAKHDGAVDPNLVRAELSNTYGLMIEPRRYSSFWRRSTSKKYALLETDGWTINNDEEGGNGGKPLRLYKLA